jgi:hypothetical protein
MDIPRIHSYRQIVQRDLGRTANPLVRRFWRKERIEVAGGPAAMAAGPTEKLWEIEDLIGLLK